MSVNLAKPVSLLKRQPAAPVIVANVDMGRRPARQSRARFQMHRDAEPFGPVLESREAVQNWLWSDAGEAAFLALPGVHDRPLCMFAQATFAVREVQA